MTAAASTPLSDLLSSKSGGSYVNLCSRSDWMPVCVDQALRRRKRIDRSVRCMLQETLHMFPFYLYCSPLHAPTFFSCNTQQHMLAYAQSRSPMVRSSLVSDLAKVPAIGKLLANASRLPRCGILALERIFPLHPQHRQYKQTSICDQVGPGEWLSLCPRHLFKDCGVIDIG